MLRAVSPVEPTSGAPSTCDRCGAGLDPKDRFCAACGVARSDAPVLPVQQVDLSPLPRPVRGTRSNRYRRRDRGRRGRRRRPLWPALAAGGFGVLILAAGAALVVGGDGSDERTEVPPAAGAERPGTTAIPPTVPTTLAPPPPTTATPTTVQAPGPGLTVESPVVINGMGGVAVGMTVEEASSAARIDLVVQDDYGFPDCYYVVPAEGPSGVSFMVTGGTVARVDIDIAGMTTRSGVGIGSSADEVRSTYPGQIVASPHTYTDGEYLTFVPRDAADADMRIVFETKGAAVTRYRAGRLPEVEYVEGCA